MKVLRGAWHWLDERGGFAKAFGPVIRHRVPPESAQGRSAWLYVWGVATLAAFLLQVVTGVILATAYVPSTAHAYDSLQFITQDATLGTMLRGMHYFGASAMVVLLAIHMVRVFLTGSYKVPRELNWLSGVVLLALTFGMAFTGQLLRWDSDAVGSVFVAAEQAGRLPLIGSAVAHFILAGQNVGAATLSRFFALHVFILPGLIFLVIGFHLYLVLHNGVSELPASGRRVDRRAYRTWYHSLLDRSGKAYFPNAAWREFLVAATIVAIVAALALTLGPKELTGPPDPTNTQASPRPDWYLLWIFALLAVIPTALEDYVIVLGPLVVAILLIALPFVAGGGERALRRRPWAPAFVAASAVVVGALLYTGVREPWAPRFGTQPLSAAVVGTSSGQVYDGSQAFYALGCQYCHTVKGQGGIRGPDLTNVVNRLTEADIRAYILRGRPEMPAYQTIISASQLDAILRFLEATAGKTGAEAH
ncbi:MAG: cytochrome b N-terminal domain-containing protein [Dehalococcoidia bacterium]|nr:cytochrome b N-terminal domain-containing protein [Dehalococcoidia bacterium]